MMMTISSLLYACVYCSLEEGLSCFLVVASALFLLVVLALVILLAVERTYLPCYPCFSFLSSSSTFHNITLSSPASIPQGTLRGRTLLEQGAANGHAPAVTRLLAAGLHQVSVAGPTLELLLYKSNTSSSFHVSWSQPALLDCKK